MGQTPHAPLPDFLDLLLDAVFLVDTQGRVVDVSAACERIFGYRPEEMIGRVLMDFVVDEDRERTRAEAQRVIAGQSRIGFQNRYLRKDGRQVHVMWSARWSEADRLRIGVARDITEQKHAEALQAATYAISEAAHGTADLDALLGEMHRIIARLVPLAGFAVAICDSRTGQLDLVYRSDRDGGTPIMPARLACCYCAGAPAGEDPQAPRLEPLRTAGSAALHGEPCWLSLPLVGQQRPIGALVLRNAPDTAYSDKDMELLRFVSEQVATVIERQQLNAELRHAAWYDELTGVPNRRLLQDRAKAALAACHRHQGRLALVYLDIDGFKQVNDSYGHAAGDALLKEVAQRLQGCVRETDTVARLGGDEFVVLLGEVDGAEAVATVVDKIRAALALPLELEGGVVRPRGEHRHGAPPRPRSGARAAPQARRRRNVCGQERQDRRAGLTAGAWRAFRASP